MGTLVKNVMAISWLLISFNSIAGQFVYIPLGSGNKVIKVDAKTDKILASYSGVENAHGLVATPDGEYLIAGSLAEKPLKKMTQKIQKIVSYSLFILHMVM